MEFSDLYDQFLLSQNHTRVPEGWLVRRHAGWALVSHPSLRVVEVWLEGARHVLAGWIIGDAISAEGEFLDAHVTLDSTNRDLESQTVERYIVTLGGRFACAIVLPSSPRFYVDAGACLAAVYSAHDRVAASTVTLVDIQKHGKATFIQPNKAFPADIPNRFFPAGLTCDPEVARVLPNHYLDLSTWRTVRYWPTGEIQRAAPEDVGDLVARIASTARQTLAAAARRYPICFGLTGGQDSRMLLACSRDIIDRCSFITFDFRAVRGRRRRYAVDLHLARKLARRFGLRHRILRLKAATEGEKAAYLRRIGYAGHWGKSQDLFDACMRNCSLDSAYIHGFGGEVGRAFYWPSRAKPRDQIMPDGLLRRMGLPTQPPFETAMADWISSVPEGDSYFLLDLLYLEQRLACWACPHLYGSAPFSLQLIPLAHRSIFDAMLRLPVEYRRQERLAHDVIQYAWPELGTIPFHEFTGARRAAQYLIDAPMRLLAGWRASRSAGTGVLA